MQADDKASVLIVDDDRNTRDGLARALRSDYEVHLAESGESALAILDNTAVDILLSDVRMPGMDGLTLLKRALAHSPELIAVLLTAYGNVETAVEAMKQGAFDFLMKPVNLDHLDILLKRALRSRDMESENVDLHRQLDRKYGMGNIVGEAQSMARMFEIIRQAAPTQATVLVQGGSGTGKELVAHAIHRLSTRAKGPFVAVHCAALSSSLLESELFGHEKGSFTGATSRRRGRFELADGGTLFLDEVSEIDPAVQVKLLRVLEERTFQRVGGNETVEVDIRLIAATNKELKALVKEGKFREDLYFRLAVVDIVLPLLRERISDIPILCDHFIAEFSSEDNKLIEGITSDAVRILSAYDWPGNVRELRNTIEKMVVFARSGRLTVRDIPANIRDSVRASGDLEPAAPTGADRRSGSLADTQRRMIQAALERHGQNRTRAAEDLGISRRTLHRKLRQYRDETS